MSHRPKSRAGDSAFSNHRFQQFWRWMEITVQKQSAACHTDSPATQPQTPDWGVHRLLRCDDRLAMRELMQIARTGIKPASGPTLFACAERHGHALAGPEFLTQLARQRHFGDQPRLKRLKSLSAFPMGIQKRGARPPARPCWRRALRAATRLEREAQAASVGRPRWTERRGSIDVHRASRGRHKLGFVSAATLTINSFCVASPIAEQNVALFHVPSRERC